MNKNGKNEIFDYDAYVYNNGKNEQKSKKKQRNKSKKSNNKPLNNYSTVQNKNANSQNVNNNAAEGKVVAEYTNTDVVKAETTVDDKKSVSAKRDKIQQVLASEQETKVDFSAHTKNATEKEKAVDSSNIESDKKFVATNEEKSADNETNQQNDVPIVATEQESNAVIENEESDTESKAVIDDSETSKEKKLPSDYTPKIRKKPVATASQNNSKSKKEKQKEKNKQKPEHIKPEDKSETLDNFKKIIDEALDEDVSDIVPAEENVDNVVPVDKAGTKRNFKFIVGLLYTFFAIVGLISSIVFCVRLINAFADNTKQKREFDEFIYPVVICDPPAFDETMKLKSDTMIYAAIWDIIINEDKSKYKADFDYIVVPEVDVEKHATKLFGLGLKFEHKSILNSDVEFYYEEDIKSYRIPLNPMYSAYSPQVEDIQKEGNTYILKVGYISPQPAWATFKGEKVVPDKYAEYTVVESNGTKYISSISQLTTDNKDSGL